MSCPWKTNAHSAGIKFLGIVRVRLRGGILFFSALLDLIFGAWGFLMGRSYPHFLLWVNYFLFCQISYAILASDGRRALSRGLGWLWRCRLGLCGVRRGRRCRSIGLSRHLSGANAHGKPNGKLSGGSSTAKFKDSRGAKPIRDFPPGDLGRFRARARRYSAAHCLWAARQG